jgi:hypothetical protein
MPTLKTPKLPQPSAEKQRNAYEVNCVFCQGAATGKPQRRQAARVRRTARPAARVTGPARQRAQRRDSVAAVAVKGAQVGVAAALLDQPKLVLCINGKALLRVLAALAGRRPENVVLATLYLGPLGLQRQRAPWVSERFACSGARPGAAAGGRGRGAALTRRNGTTLGGSGGGALLPFSPGGLVGVALLLLPPLELIAAAAPARTFSRAALTCWASSSSAAPSSAVSPPAVATPPPSSPAAPFLAAGLAAKMSSISDLALALVAGFAGCCSAAAGATPFFFLPTPPVGPPGAALASFNVSSFFVRAICAAAEPATGYRRRVYAWARGTPAIQTPTTANEMLFTLTSAYRCRHKAGTPVRRPS